MRRRTFLARYPGTLGVGAAGLTAGTVGTAGCLDGLGAVSDESFTPSTRVENPPSRVYRPPAVSSQRLVGIADAGELRIALLYGYPARFWEVVGEQTYRRRVDPDDDVHLSAIAWDPDTGIVFPEIGLTMAVERDGALVTEEAVYAMLSQRMGFHYGDNFALDGDATYAVTVSVGGLQLRRTGPFEDRFGDPASHTFAFAYERAVRDELAVLEPPQAGAPGAVAPQLPTAVPPAVPPPTDASTRAVPGDRLATPTASGVVFDVRVVTAEAPLARLSTGSNDESTTAGSRYLAVTPQTPVNELLLPSMGLQIRLTGMDATESPFEAILDRTMDPALGYHHGTTVPANVLDAASDLVIETMTPPQVARHDGYETAFLDVDPVSIEV